MNIGVFDSGLGGLIITKSLIKAMPQYNFCYLGDTKYVPYGNRSKEVVYDLTKRCIDYLFNEKDCKLIIIACNTATIASLRKLQQEYLPSHYNDRRILGVIIPTLETIIERQYNKIGLFATNGTINSNVYDEELKKLNPNIKLYSQATPLLVPLIENNGDKYATPIIKDYISNLNKDIEAIILGCTHYPHYKKQIKDEAEKLFNHKVDIISQDEIIPEKTMTYLNNHPEIDACLSKESKHIFELTDITKSYIEQATNMFQHEISIKKIDL